MSDLPLCTTLGCKEIAVSAIASKNSGPTVFIRFCKPFGFAHEFWKVISLDESVILEIIES